MKSMACLLDARQLRRQRRNPQHLRNDSRGSFDEIQRLGGLLSISKRRMVEMALRDIAISANKALDEVGFDAPSMTYRSLGEIPVDQE